MKLHIHTLRLVRLSLPVLLAQIFLLSLPSVATAAVGNGDWPSYNRTLTSERFSPLSSITPDNVSRLKVVCTYDTGVETSFQTGPIVVNGTMYVTTQFDTIALDPATCKEKWRVHEQYTPASPLQVNRGVAYLDGRLFRGTQDGRVIAYDAATGKKLWTTQIAYPKKGESVPAAPIAWSGLVFVGNAGGDNYSVKGRMYALDAKTGKVVWEFYLVPKENEAKPGASASTSSVAEVRRASWDNEAGVPIAGGATWTSYTLDPVTGLLYVPGGNPAPDFASNVRPGVNLFTNSVVVLDARTGAYKAHYQLVPEDFHDWDVAAAPVLITTPKGRHILAAAPKNGYLYGYDLTTGKRLYKVPVDTIENADEPLTPAGTHFCPGTQGGAEWNGPAYSPDTDLIYTGEVDWCSTVKALPPEEAKHAEIGQPWSGSANQFGKLDPKGQWAGWLYASNAETGKTKWRFKAPVPLMSGVTPTAGGIVFFGDMAGNFYALDAADGRKLWSYDTKGAIGGGVISYEADGKQRIAVATGMTSPIWPADKVTAKIVVFGLQ